MTSYTEAPSLGLIEASAVRPCWMPRAIYTEAPSLGLIEAQRVAAPSSWVSRIFEAPASASLELGLRADESRESFGRRRSGPLFLRHRRQHAVHDFHVTLKEQYIAAG